MPNRHIQGMTIGLPYSLREAVNGYVDAVAAALPEIQREARVEIADVRTDEFLIVVAIRRIWASVNNQYWTMNDCIEIASRSDVAASMLGTAQTRGFRVGRDEISADSAAFLESRQLRQRFEELIIKLEIEEVVAQSAGLSDLARRMFAQPQ